MTFLQTENQKTQYLRFHSFIFLIKLHYHNYISLTILVNPEWNFSNHYFLAIRILKSKQSCLDRLSQFKCDRRISIISSLKQ
ncbi:unnamed protein product [Paramecium pentaurelia]|uniref:Uncharacterized protein n=1 Tax=Paramecium pentaurelia TaxID=43138 RepID=A0A8S1T4N7_9CILI|nr:unnamed protein product [Paramecium pentaurelia]